MAAEAGDIVAITEFGADDVIRTFAAPAAVQLGDIDGLAAGLRGTSTDEELGTSGTNGSVKPGPLDASNPHWDLKAHLVRKKQKIEDSGWANRSIGISWRNLSVSVETKEDDRVATVAGCCLQMLGCSSKETEVKTLLDGITGYCRPGEMLLVLGAPGSGCSTLLHTIGNLLPPNIKAEGSLKYNGVEDIGPYQRSIRLISDSDTHLPGLTVEDTLTLAAELNLPLDYPDRAEAIESSVTNVLHVLGLYGVRHTIVGDEDLRGVSGGEKKRVGIGEMLLSQSYCLLMDEYTKGLDASAALDIARTIKVAVKTFNATIIATQYQASQAIYNLFDRVMLLHGGQCIFFGRPGEAVPYFHTIGIDMPDCCTVPDFLSALGSEQEAKGVLARTLAAEFHASSLYRQLVEEAKTVTAPEVKQCEARIKANTRAYAVPLKKQVALHVHRSLRLMSSNSKETKARLIRCCIGLDNPFLINGFLMGLTFFMLDQNDIGLYTRAGLLFFICIYVSFSSFGALGLTFQRRDVFYKYQDARFASASAYVLSHLCIEFFLQLVEVVFLILPLYFLVDLNTRDNGEGFFYFFLLCYATNLAFSSITLFSASLTPNVGLGQAMSAGIIVTSVFFSGFLLNRESIPPWFIWLHYLSPCKYFYEGALINEYDGLTFNVDGTLIDGREYIQETFDMHYSDPQTFKWLILAIFLAYFVVFSALAGWALGFVRHSATVSSAVKYKRKHEPAAKARFSAPRSSFVAIGIEKETTGPIPAFLTWDEISYDVWLPKEHKQDVRRKRRLLESITGYVKPGMMVALMGSSGAGKTTLLDVLARRKTGGIVEGKIRVNGTDQTAHFKRFAGYVEQTDVHSPRSTVREAITFSARMRLPAATTTKEIRAKVKETLAVLELATFADAIIGGAGVANGLPADVVKRVTIAVELVADPSILFMDEPSSGLDTVGARTVMQVARNIADAGHSVICTIHQPSAQLFQLFDHLLLMQRGGFTVYHGPLGADCSTLLGYFKRNGAPNLKDNENPADYILEQVGAGIGVETSENWAVAWSRSEESKALRDSVKAQTMVASDTRAFQFKSESSLGPFSQFRYLLARQFRTYWRNPSYNLTRQLFAVAVSLFIGLSYLNTGEDQEGLRSRTTVLYFSGVIGLVALLNSMPPMALEKTVYNRERAAGMYGTAAYFWASFAVELPFLAATTLLYVNIFYWMVGLRTERYAFFLLVYFTFQTFNVSFGQLVAVWTPSLQVAQHLAPAVNALWGLYSGFLITRSEIPPWFIWLHYFNPVTYFTEAILVNELEGAKFSNDGSLALSFDTGNEYLDFLDMDKDSKWRDWGILVGFVVAIRALTFWGLSRQRGHR